MLNIIGVFAGVIALVTLGLSWKSVNDTATYNANFTLCRGKAIQNLTDIRYAQKAYAEANGRYAEDWETLVEFIKNGTGINAFGDFENSIESFSPVDGKKIAEVAFTSSSDYEKVVEKAQQAHLEWRKVGN